MKRIETERLFIRDMKLDDKNDIFEYRSDVETNKYQSWIPKTLEDVEVFIKNNPNEFNKPDTWYQLLIICKESNCIVGDLGIHFIGLNNNMQVEIGITLNKKYQKRGYANESLSGLFEFLFKTLKKHRITASIDPNNINSIKLFEQLHFRKEAHFIKSLLINNKWVDDIVYALLFEDWLK
ncbi:hypothetical protein RB653_005440 [Dictyostelium firmibasis]|uniref:N-acetyltransferase domain-containing protein n=1 Tax=Dictyostelium firmibasis TaxID=79012 RepID=A0AAN7U7D6_9MYCE